MRIGVLKEQKTDETRVALLPVQCCALVKAGHEVLVESTAGQIIHIDDSLYAEAGARIVPPGDAVKQADLIVGVKYPPRAYLAHLNERQFLFAYLHLDENTPKEYAEALRQSGATAIAYEWVGTDGKCLLLEPMSRLAGTLFAWKGLELLLKGKGKVPLSYGGRSPRVMIAGIGRMGREAIRVFSMNGCELVIVDKHPETLPDRIGAATAAGACIIKFDAGRLSETLQTIRRQVARCDIVLFTAVRRPDLPKAVCAYILRESDVLAMEPGSVVMDATACIRDFIETAVPSEKLDASYVIGGVTHYNPDHIPALAGVTASELLTEATFPYIQAIAERGTDAVLADPALRNGVVTYRCGYTHEYTCKLKGYPYSPLP